MIKLNKIDQNIDKNCIWTYN